MSGFKKFLMRGNVIELAIAVVIGAAFTAIVNSFVKDVLTLISAFGGHPRLPGPHHDRGRRRLPLRRVHQRRGRLPHRRLRRLLPGRAPLHRVSARFARQEEVTTRDCPHRLSEIPTRPPPAVAHRTSGSGSPSPHPRLTSPGRRACRPYVHLAVAWSIACNQPGVSNATSTRHPSRSGSRSKLAQGRRTSAATSAPPYGRDAARRRGSGHPASTCRVTRLSVQEAAS